MGGEGEGPPEVSHGARVRARPLPAPCACAGILPGLGAPRACAVSCFGFFFFAWEAKGQIPKLTVGGVLLRVRGPFSEETLFFCS